MDKDIQEMFRKKNREILITNLKFDLDKNIDSLLDTITNIFNLEFETAVKKINAIMLDANICDGLDYVTDTINAMKEKNYSDIETFIKEKKELLVNNIDILEFTEDEIKKYYDLVFDSTKLLINDLKKEFIDVADNKFKTFESYINNNKNVTNQELTIIRIKDYINNRLYGKLETKIHMEIMLRDNNLINKAKEVYLRYQEICSKTITQ